MLRMTQRLVRYCFSVISWRRPRRPVFAGIKGMLQVIVRAMDESNLRVILVCFSLLLYSSTGHTFDGNTPNHRHPCSVSYPEESDEERHSSRKQFSCTPDGLTCFAALISSEYTNPSLAHYVSNAFFPFLFLHCVELLQRGHSGKQLWMRSSVVGIRPDFGSNPHFACD